MMLSPKEKQHIECQFAAFCTVVFRNTVCTYFRDLGRKRSRETSLDYLSEQKHFEPYSTDEYFVKCNMPTCFNVHR